MRRRFTSVATEDFDALKYLTVRALEDISIEFSKDVDYNINGNEWETLKGGYRINISKNEYVCFKKEDSSGHAGIFAISGMFSLEGNCMSIIFGDNFEDAYNMTGHSLGYLFSGCSGLQYVSKDFLPATILSNGCYAGMFMDCTSLVKAPELPATTLANECYSEMFARCTSLVTAPELPATTLVSQCYKYMFSECTNLNYIKMFATDVEAYGTLSYWVTSVSSTGIFVKNKNATWNTTPGALGYDGVPAGWTVVNDEEESGDSLFPATLISSNNVENIPNYTIAQYFLDTYPDMIGDFNGKYSPITEDVTIQGTNYCDGKVVGVTKWYNDETHHAVVFYTENSINNLHGLRVCAQFKGLPQGSTNEIFFD